MALYVFTFEKQITHYMSWTVEKFVYMNIIYTYNNSKI